jgi:hypothetical protein
VLPARAGEARLFKELHFPWTVAPQPAQFVISAAIAGYKAGHIYVSCGLLSALMKFESQHALGVLGNTGGNDA